MKDYKTVGLEQTVRDREGSAPSEPMKSKMTKMDIAREFARTPSLLLTYFGFAGMMFLSISLSSFLPTYFQRVQGMNVQTATFMTSGIMLMAIPGSPLGGLDCRPVDEKEGSGPPAGSLPLGRGHRRPVFLRDSFLLRGGFPVRPLPRGQYRLHRLGVFGDRRDPGCGPSGIEGHFLRALRHRSKPSGKLLGPLVTGFFSDAYGIATALKIASTMAVVSCILFYLGSRFYQRDLAKVERVALTRGKITPSPPPMRLGGCDSCPRRAKKGFSVAARATVSMAMAASAAP